jgi:ElaB/YqjD/DUF883 family membrane-anchored ribosome-binding protein
MDDLRSRSPQDEDENDESAAPEPRRPVFVEISGAELRRRAATVGKVAGTAVAVFRDARRRLREPGQTRDDHLSELGATARTRVWELRREAADHAEDWRRAALEKTAELRRQAKTSYDKVRGRAQQVGHDHPLQVVVVAGIVGFLIGAGLRIRRANRGG